MRTDNVIPLFAGEADLEAAWAVLDRALRNGGDTRDAERDYARVFARQAPAPRTWTA